MLCLSGFELYSQWVPLDTNKNNGCSSLSFYLIKQVMGQQETCVSLLQYTLYAHKCTHAQGLPHCEGLWTQLFRNRSVSSFTFCKIDINTSTVRGGWQLFILAREDQNV